MNRKMLKEIISNMDMDVVKELDEYGKNKLAALMEGLLIEIMGKERYEYLLENPEDKGNGTYKRSLNVIRRAKIHHQRLLKVHHF